MTIALPQYLTAEASPALPAPGVKRRFHVMAKPIGSACNLDCTYCYYLSKEGLLAQERGRRMPDDLLEQFIRQYIEGQDGDEVVFSWQGGEPTLLGLGYFQRIVEFQAKHQKPGQKIENDLQTNGTLLDDDWCRFLKKHGFLVGLSIDGPRDLHDAYRVTRGGKPTFDKVMEGVGLLRKHAVRFNTLTVVNRLNAQRPLDVYRFLRREIGSTYIQFIPCVEPTDFHRTAPQYWDAARLPVMGSDAARPGSPDSVVTDWSVEPDDWGRFLISCFDEWRRRDLGKVLVNLFETAVVQTTGMPAQLCTTSEFCGKALAVEHDGSLFSCDHYVYPEYKLGNIQDQPLPNMIFSQRQMDFGFAKCNSLPQFCRECPHLKLCWGECPRNRLIRTPDGTPGLNYLCAGLKAFFAHAQPHLKDMARQLELGIGGVRGA